MARWSSKQLESLGQVQPGNKPAAGRKGNRLVLVVVVVKGHEEHHLIPEWNEELIKFWREYKP